MMAMDIPLNNGRQMPMVGFGTYLLKDETECKKLVLSSLQVGYRLIDTASVYKNEPFVGEVLSDHKQLDQLGLKRSDIFVTTKVGPADQGKDSCRASVLKSLENLKLDYVDLVLIHWPGVSGHEPHDPIHAIKRQESWQDLEALCRDGKVRSIGVSNYTIEHLKQLLSHCSIRPSVNQVEFHPLLFQLELLNYCKSEQIVLQAYSSLGSAKGWETLSNNQVLMDITKKKGKISGTGSLEMGHWT
jgi:diketogulonate reductase-like aldo/keto reductase